MNHKIKWSGIKEISKENLHVKQHPSFLRLVGCLAIFVRSSVKFSEINFSGMSDCGKVSKHLLEFRHKIRSKAFVMLNHRKMPDVFHNSEPASLDDFGNGLGHFGGS